MAREFEKLTVSKRDSPVRHPSRNRTIRPGQLQKVCEGARARPPQYASLSPTPEPGRLVLQLTQARQMGNRAQFKPGIGDNSMGFPKSAWCVAVALPCRL